MTPLRIAALCAVAATVAVAAEPLNIRPGQWKISTALTPAGAPLYIEGLPATAGSDYAKQWAKDAGKTQTNVDEDCITEKDIHDIDFFKDMKDGSQSCRESLVKQTSTAIVATLDCKDAKTTTRTELNYQADSPTSFRGTLKSTVTSPNGVTTMTATIDAKWVAASCPKGDDQ
jgi:hypothetical protein